MSEPKILISGGSYQSPIHQIVGDISTQIIQDGENQIFQAIQKSNIVVEKDELIKALQYDRNQYDKGYSDGRASAIKTGHWIESNIPNEKYICSECGGACWYYDVDKYISKSRYCPNCGAEMENV
jgi:rubrerythrin